ncbi:hypothetical protein RZS08_23165, partial [Arthrospira platensis SPKY1]|nr:hypothetical protein [Arthrospira platensis SPKY1]
PWERRQSRGVEGEDDGRSPERLAARAAPTGNRRALHPPWERRQSRGVEGEDDGRSPERLADHPAQTRRST